MNLTTVFGVLKTHATTATTGLGGKWDIDIAPPLPRGCSIRLFYAGPRPSAKYEPDNTLTSEIVAQAITIRAFWPVADYAKDRRRNLMYDMAAYCKALRTAIDGDKQLGGACQDLTLELDEPDDILFGTAHYAIVDTTCLVEYDEFSIAA